MAGRQWRRGVAVVMAVSLGLALTSPLGGVVAALATHADNPYGIKTDRKAEAREREERREQARQVWGTPRWWERGMGAAAWCQKRVERAAVQRLEGAERQGAELPWDAFDRIYERLLYDCTWAW
jgi:hypothetical protein